MRIAIISDIHGNYTALKAVLEDARRNNVDKFIFLGDYVFDLPFSNEVAQLLMNLDNVHIIKGNREMYLSEFAKQDQATWTVKQFGGMYHVFRELAPDVFDFLTGLDEECHIEIRPGASIFATHIPHFLMPPPKNICNSSTTYHKKMMEKPFSHGEFLTEFKHTVHSDKCKVLIDRIDANIILFGHNHLQAHAYCGDKLILNPGSCGISFIFDNRAPYTILEITASGFDVQEKRVAYDVDYTIAQLKNSLLYQKGKIWSDLTCLALKNGRDYYGIFFEIAEEIKLAKGETGFPYTNQTWDEAGKVFANKYMK